MMNFSTKYINILLASLIGFFSITADVKANQNPVEIAHIALNKLDQIDSEHWSYKHVRKSAKETTSSYFDPRRADAQRWQLLLVNNKVPTIEEINEFNEIWNQLESLSEDEEEQQTAGMSKMVMRQSLTLDRTDNGIAYFNFLPQLDDMPQESEKLVGQLTVDVASQHVLAISIKNKEPLTPAFSIQLDNFKMDFEFALIDQKPVYKRIVMDMSGTAGFVKDISEQTIEEFSEYYYVGPNS